MERCLRWGMASQIRKEFEIKNIAKACEISDKIFQEMIENFNFKKESEIMKFIFSKAKENKCGIAFRPVVASGKDAAKMHYMRNYKILRMGFCVIDFGVRYKKYCSDITRTIFIGKPNAKEIKLYNLVLRAQENSIKRAKEGALCSELTIACKKDLGKYGEKMTHTLGHGIGKRVHQRPWFGKKFKDVLKKNMVFTIEPGIYFPNETGIRIEDTVVLRDKLVLLTKSTKKLICVNV